ncbi:MAG: Sir2 family NAD-dependent protein deacetylase [Thermodesulfobacteriota bacterium]|nr:Sir2 family NAD-dependent protein deacetylase [Thermodesulfobacteriota bacterium]
MSAINTEIEKAYYLINKANRIVIFTGAGISTESGIPDFRSPGGLWDKYDPSEFIFQNFLTREDVRKKYWDMNKDLYPVLSGSLPNAAHLFCVELEKVGKLDCIITQNIDNLHQKAGNNPEKIIELHGNALRVKCLSCEKFYSRKSIQELLESGVEVPRCDDCGGLLKPDSISFGQPMPVHETKEAENRSRNCDLFIIIGSSLVVYPAAMMPLYAKEQGAKLIIINLTPTPHDAEADIIIRGSCGEITKAIQSELKKMEKQKNEK